MPRFDDGPVCLGWLRASHRELDTTKSRPEQPVLLHKRAQDLEPGRVYELNVELLASSTVYHTGEKLRFIVQGTDVYVGHVVLSTTDSSNTLDTEASK